MELKTYRSPNPVYDGVMYVDLSNKNTMENNHKVFRGNNGINFVSIGGCASYDASTDSSTPYTNTPAWYNGGCATITCNPTEIDIYTDGIYVQISNEFHAKSDESRKKLREQFLALPSVEEFYSLVAEYQGARWWNKKSLKRKIRKMYRTLHPTGPTTAIRYMIGYMSDDYVNHRHTYNSVPKDTIRAILTNILQDKKLSYEEMYLEVKKNLNLSENV